MLRCLFEYGPLLAWVLMLLTVVRPLHLRRRWQFALAAGLLLLATQKFLVYKFIGGDTFVPELPALFINVTGWLYSASMILCLLSLLPPYRWARIRLSALAVVALVVAACGIWAGVRVPDVHRVEIEVDGLPREFDGFRIVQLTDIHCSPAAREGRTRGVVEKTNALHPDLICITGDLVDGPTWRRAKDLAPLRDLRARYGVLGCTGNHEYYSDYAAWREVYALYGITMLDNAHRVIEHNGAQLVVGGVTDMAAMDNRVRIMEPGDVRRAFAGAPKGAFRVLLQHRPAFVRSNAAEGVRLQLSGHTHGGAILGLDRLVARIGNEDHVRGIYREHGLTLYVSPGTGQWAGFPQRLGVPAEITELVLRSRL